MSSLVDPRNRGVPFGFAAKPQEKRGSLKTQPPNTCSFRFCQVSAEGDLLKCGDWLRVGNAELVVRYCGGFCKSHRRASELRTVGEVLKMVDPFCLGSPQTNSRVCVISYFGAKHGAESDLRGLCMQVRAKLFMCACLGFEGMPPFRVEFTQESLKDTFCNHSKHVAFSTQVKGNHHLQGNVQVYNVRIPVTGTPTKLTGGGDHQKMETAGFCVVLPAFVERIVLLPLLYLPQKP